VLFNSFQYLAVFLPAAWLIYFLFCRYAPQQRLTALLVLWHGAGLTFLAWGVFHGIGLGAEVIWRKINLPMPKALFGPLTFLFVVLCWVLFRSQTFSGATRMYEALLWSKRAGSDVHLDRPYSAVIVAMAAILALMLPNTTELISKIKPRPIYAVGFGLMAAIAVLSLNSTENFEFIYFHF
jgi:alginate O-acetyltransferase complex protein AlgI